jgi:uncharacterized protein YukE
MAPSCAAIPGDPGALNGAAGELQSLAAKIATLADDVGAVASSARDRASWRGEAADRYTAHTERLRNQVRELEAPLHQAAGAIRTYAAALSSAQSQMVDAQGKLAGASSLPPTVRDAAVHDAQQSANAAVLKAHQAATTAASQVSGAMGSMPSFGPRAQAKGASEAETGVHIMELIDKLNQKLGYPLLPSAIASLGFEANAVFQAWQAGRAVGAVPAEAAAWFSELVGPTGLAFDRGLATFEDFAAPLARWQARLDAAQAFTKQGVDEAAKLLGSGGIREGGALDVFGRFLGGVGVLSDVMTVINPGESGTRGTVTRVVAGVNGVTTVAAMTGTLTAVGAIDASVGWVPVAGQVVIVGTGLFLAGDWAYNNVKPFHDFVDTAASDTASVAKTAWHGLSSGVSSVGHFLGIG